MDPSAPRTFDAQKGSPTLSSNANVSSSAFP
jgi:hypothetical protein